VHDSSADAIATLRSYFIEEISQRRASPGDDLISTLVSGQHETETLRLDELLALVLLLLFASDTTTNLIANGLLALSPHPDQLRCLGLAAEALISRGARSEEAKTLVVPHLYDERGLLKGPVSVPELRFFGGRYQARFQCHR
jgi:cytochrome P450